MRKAIFTAVVVGLVLAACGNPYQSGLTTDQSTADGIYTIPVEIQGLPGATLARGIMMDDEISWVHVQALNSTDTEVGGGWLTRQEDSWKGSIEVSEDGSLTFRAKGGSGSQSQVVNEDFAYYRYYGSNTETIPSDNPVSIAVDPAINLYYHEDGRDNPPKIWYWETGDGGRDLADARYGAYEDRPDMRSEGQGWYSYTIDPEDYPIAGTGQELSVQFEAEPNEDPIAGPVGQSYWSQGGVWSTEKPVYTAPWTPEVMGSFNEEDGAWQDNGPMDKMSENRWEFTFSVPGTGDAAVEIDFKIREHNSWDNQYTTDSLVNLNTAYDLVDNDGGDNNTRVMLDPGSEATVVLWFTGSDEGNGTPQVMVEAEVDDTPPVEDFPEIPAELVNPTMYQFFYWESYPGLWGELTDDTSGLYAMAEELAEAGVTSFWLPPAAKPMEGTDGVGYSLYDIWDLGEFDQRDTVATRYGTKNELTDALAVLSTLGIDAYFDVVFNHRMGAETSETVPLHEGDDVTAWTRFDFAGRQAHYTSARWGDLYHDFVWDWTAFNAVDYYNDTQHDNPVTFEGKYGYWDTIYHDQAYLMGNDVDYRRADIADEMKAWGAWIINDVGFAGFRMDAIAHVDANFTRDWVNHVQANTTDEVFFVGEAWVDNVGGYLDYVNTPHLRGFDFTLRNDFVDLSSGDKNMQSWGGLINSGHREHAVTFIDNHDTSREVAEGEPDYNQDPVDRFKNQAYAYLLMREEGVPSVYARDWDEFGMAPTIKQLIQARRYFAYGPGHENTTNTQEVYAYIREGLSEVTGTGMVMMISGRNSGGQQTLSINSRQPDTTFVDFTGNVGGSVTTDGSGNGDFTVNLTEGTGWSIWVPQTD